MADNFSIGLIGTMDHLWFHHAILFSEPSCPKPPFLAASKLSSSYSCSSNNSCEESSVSEEENPSLEVEIRTPIQDDQCDDGQQIEKETERERPTRLNHIPGKSRSHSSSPSGKKSKETQRNRAGATIKLQKSMSCKSSCDLELEEVKGFMDLGFRFKKEQLSKRMTSVIPGLQRLDLFKNDEKYSDDDEEEEEEENGAIIRPYLSEAWLIRRADSPLLNLRIPTRVSTAADMKNHLKYWARTVASAIQQESC